MFNFAKQTKTMSSGNLNIKQIIRKKIFELAPNAKAILYGSRARGTAGPESDWDILILLDKERIEVTDHDKIVYPLFELGWQLDQKISVKLYTKKGWTSRSFTPFYKNIEKEGIKL